GRRGVRGGRAGRSRARREPVPAARAPVSAPGRSERADRADRAAAAAPPRIDPAVIRQTLRDAGLRARHALSQNFLADPEILEAILAEAAPVPGARVLEIGPGLGFLTGGLLDAGAAVTAVELDRGLAAFLRDRFGDDLEAGR